MASYTVRVMLHEAESEDYETLHEKMEEQGFSRTITSDEGITYQLPDAEYVISSDQSRTDILAKAKTASNQTNLKFAILVTQSAGRTWSGLGKA